MERLVVKNFLLLQDVDLEIKKYNFLLGPQASGKSILAKLIYFIYKIPSIIEDTVLKEEQPQKIIPTMVRDFCSIFPENYWNKDSFSIEYQLDDFSLYINSFKDSSEVKFSFSKEAGKIFEKILSLNISKETDVYKRNLSNSENKKIVNRLRDKFYSEFRKLISNSSFKEYFTKGEACFIPSSRSIYSILSEMPAKNSSLFTMDIIFNNFAIEYEKAKLLYYRHFKIPALLKTEEFIKLENSILKGEHVYTDNGEFLSINGDLINLINLSSGQQEVLPLIMMLKYYASLGDASLFIEEPEAHLFPESQAKIMTLLTYLIVYDSGLSLFITTHSPYLLSILNNFLYGSKLIEEGKISEDKFIEITSGARPINTSDINAFTLENGKSESLMDEDGIFIDSSVLDSASTFINDMYDNFIDYTLNSKK